MQISKVLHVILTFAQPCVFLFGNHISASIFNVTTIHPLSSLMSTPFFPSHSRSVNKQFSALSLAHGFYARQVASHYHFPITQALGGGHCIGIISLGGGYHQSDIASYFDHIGYSMPHIIHVLVNGQPHTTAHATANAELTLDTQIAGAIAPEANIVIYHAPNNEEGFIAALRTAVRDTTNRPDVLSISWGRPETKWTKQGIKKFEALLEAAATAGITVCVSSGNNGSSGGVPDGNVHIDYPASSAWVLCCGGTTLQQRNGIITSLYQLFQRSNWNFQ